MHLDPGNALSLLLNVEQYEYMRGPQNDAGVKVNILVHPIENLEVNQYCTCVIALDHVTHHMI